MSLIFSALAEIDKQAREGTAEPPALAAPPVAPASRGPVIGLALAIAAVLVVVVGLGSYLLRDTPAPAVRTTAATPTAVPAPAPAPAPQAMRQASPAASDAMAAAPAAAVASTPPASGPGSPAAATPPWAETAAAAVAPAAEPPHPLAPTVRVVRGGPAPPALAAVEPRPAVADVDVPRSAPPPRASAPAAEPATPAHESVPGDLAASTPRAARPAASPAHEAPVEDRAAPVSVPTPAPRIASASTGAPRRAPVAAPVADAAPTLGSNNSIEVGTQPAPVHDGGIAPRVAAFESAMRAGDHTSARKALDGLEASLPPRSLTLWRMQAWYALDTGDDAGARSLYQRILQRLPDDVNAALNSALIEARSGHRDLARQMIDELHTQHPESALVTRYWQAMHGNR